MYVCMYIYTFRVQPFSRQCYLYIYTCVRTYVRTHVYIRTYLYGHVHVYIYMYNMYM